MAKRQPEFWSTLPSPKRYCMTSLVDDCDSPHTAVIDHSAFPHIFDAILGHLAFDPLALVTLRGVSRELRDWSDARLTRHVIIHHNRTLCSPTETTSLAPPIASPASPEYAQSSSLSCPKGERSASPTAQSLRIDPETPVTSASDQGSTPTAPPNLRTWGPHYCSPSVAMVEMTATGAQIRRLPPLYLRNTEYHWRTSESDLSATTRSRLRHSDRILKSSTIVDIAAGVGDYPNFIVQALALPLKTVRLVANNTCPELSGKIKAETAVFFTRLGLLPFDHSGVSLHVDSEVKRVVVKASPPRLPELGDGEETRICWVRRPANVSEVVYIFDPSWQASTQVEGPRQPRGSSILDAVIHYAARSLPKVRYVFVGIEALPLKSLVLPREYYWEKMMWYKSLSHTTMMRLRTLGLQVLGPRVLSPDEDTLCWLWRLFKLDLPDDLSVDDVRLAMESAEHADLGGVEAERRASHAAQIRDDIRSTVRSYIEDFRSGDFGPPPDSTFRPADQWPDERIDALLDEHLVFYSNEEYRQKVGEDEWRLWTMEPVA